MKLRFSVDQAEAFRRGIDAPKSIVTVEVKPSDLPQDIRNLIADRLDGIDVRKLVLIPDIESDMSKPVTRWIRGMICSDDAKPVLIQADEPSLESLIAAVKRDEQRLQDEANQPPKRVMMVEELKQSFDALATRFGVKSPNKPDDSEIITVKEAKVIAKHDQTE